MANAYSSSFVDGRSLYRTSLHRSCSPATGDWTQEHAGMRRLENTHDRLINKTERISTQGVVKYNKKAVLSLRWPRNAPYTWVPWNFRDSLTTPTATIPNIFHRLLFQSNLWMFLQNLKSVALPVPEIIIGSTTNICVVPGYADAPFSPKFLTGFYSDWPRKCTRKIWSP